MASVEFDIREFESFCNKVQELDGKADTTRVLEAGTNQLAALYVREAKKRTPVGKRGSVKAFMGRDKNGKAIYLTYHYNTQQTRNSWRVDAAKITGNDGTAASLTIPAVSTGGREEELFNENGVKIYRRADGQAVLEFPVYAMLDQIYNNPNIDSLHFDSLELNELSSGGDDITITGMMLLAKLTSKAYFPKGKAMPAHVHLPNQSEQLNLEFRQKREREGYALADDVFSWANIDCDGSTWDYGSYVGYVKQEQL
nr:MAG TPA: hypothetical protein [Caudoviricetes sp.]